MPLVDDAGEQALLEQILEDTKPRWPADVSGLDYLLATPFRYPPPARGSRFRSPLDPGVFYAAEERRTACAELGYWRWRFLREADGLAGFGPVPHTVFQSRVSGKLVDLSSKPFLRDRRRWMDPDSYSATQAFASNCRMAGVDLIRYASVRDPEHAACVAVLTPAAFGSRRSPDARQTWMLTVALSGVTWIRDARERFEFRWDR